jgi:dTDP-glucose 4,6-dehydratase
MHNVLVTGGAGFIGSNFVRYLLEKEPGVHVYNLDALTYAGSLENLRDLPNPERHTFVQGDICDTQLVINLLRDRAVDTVVHFAAESHVDRSIVGPSAFVQTNVVGTFSLLEAVRQVWLVERPLPLAELRFHHISTDEVYGSLQPEETPWTEDAPYAPHSPYAASKAASDHLVRAYGHTYGLPFTITNCSNNYGPHQFPEKLIPLIILNALEGKPLPVYGDGAQVRDWLYVEDHCEAIHQVLTKGEPGETYHVGGENGLSNLELVERICALLDERPPGSPYAPYRNLIRHVTDRPGHDRRYALDASKIRRTLGWEPRHSLEAGLEETVNWYLGQADWVRSVRERADYRAWLERNYSGREGNS